MLTGSESVGPCVQKDDAIFYYSVRANRGTELCTTYCTGVCVHQILNFKVHVTNGRQRNVRILLLALLKISIFYSIYKDQLA